MGSAELVGAWADHLFRGCLAFVGTYYYQRILSAKALIENKYYCPYLYKMFQCKYNIGRNICEVLLLPRLETLDAKIYPPGSRRQQGM
jgi:hypothetical protein